MKRKVPLSGMLICIPINPVHSQLSSTGPKSPSLTIGVARQVMEGDSLTEVERLVIKGFPVAVESVTVTRWD
jgi:hypothetical protein